MQEIHAVALQSRKKRQQKVSTTGAPYTCLANATASAPSATGVFTAQAQLPEQVGHPFGHAASCASAAGQAQGRVQEGRKEMPWLRGGVGRVGPGRGLGARLVMGGGGRSGEGGEWHLGRLRRSWRVVSSEVRVEGRGMSEAGFENVRGDA